MCRLFTFADPDSYEAATRKLRIHGHSTSIRLEHCFWTVIEEIARAEGKSVGRLVTSIHDELRQAESDFTNFASCLRVIALHYGMRHSGSFAPSCRLAGGVRRPWEEIRHDR